MFFMLPAAVEFFFYSFFFFWRWRGGGVAHGCCYRSGLVPTRETRRALRCAALRCAYYGTASTASTLRSALDTSIYCEIKTSLDVQQQ